MDRRQWKRFVPVLVLCALVMGPPADAAMTFVETIAPMDEEFALRFPEGCAAVANLPGRTGFWVGPVYGINATFVYRDQTLESFNTALETFAQIQYPRLFLEIRDDGRSLSDWTFTVVSRSGLIQALPIESREPSANTFNDRAAPTITVDLSKFPLDWSEVHIPDNVTVLDRRSARDDVWNADIEVGVYGFADGRALETGMVAVYEDWRREESVHAYKLSPFAPVAVKGRFEWSFYLEASAPGYVTEWRRLRIPESGAPPAQHFFLSEAVTIHGIVVDAAGDPVENARVWLVDSRALDKDNTNRFQRPAIVETGTDGRFEMDGVRRGLVRLLATTQTVSAGTPAFCDTDEEIVIVLPAPGRIEGRVDALSRVGGNNGSLHVRTDIKGMIEGFQFVRRGDIQDDGTFSVDGLTPGSYLVWLLADGPDRSDYNDYDFRDIREDVLVLPGQTTEVVLDTNLTQRR